MSLTDTQKWALAEGISFVDKMEAFAKAVSTSHVTEEAEKILPWLTHVVGPLVSAVPILGTLANVLPMIQSVSEVLELMALHGMSPDDPRNIERTNANQD